MKKILSLILVLCMAFSVCMLTACSNKSSKVDPEKNIYEDLEEFDSYVPKGSDIIGTWKMTSPDTNKEWQFFANTTLHLTETKDDVQMSTVCTYNYDGEGTLKVYGLSASLEAEYAVSIEGDTLVLTAEDNTELKFEKTAD